MKRILVADDSVTIQKVIALTFADEPFEVKSVGTGTEALEVMRTWKPDILLADVIMPQMNGYELCRAVKENPETSSLPVLFLAGTFEAFDEEEAGSVGADDFITKPFESGELIEKVQILTSPKTVPEEVSEIPAAEVPDARTAPPPADIFSLPEEPASESPGFEAPPFPEEEVFSGAEKPSLSPVPESPPREVSPSVPEPPAPASPAGGSEPDIWDILSEVEDLVPGSMAEPESERVSGLNPAEEKGVIDVGSFDVGLDRPESSIAPPEPEPESWDTTPPESGKEPAAEDFSPVIDRFAEDYTGFGKGNVPVQNLSLAGPPGEEVRERSRVEDREKDFFGFEVDSNGVPSEDDGLGDAVEEITFEVDESPPQQPDAGPGILPTERSSFPGNEQPGPSPELAQEPLSGGAPEPLSGFSEPFSTDDRFESSPQGFAPAEEWGDAPEAAEPPIALEPAEGPAGDKPAPEIPSIQGAPGKTEEDSEPPLELDMKGSFAGGSITSEGVSEDQLRKIIEERVEKVVWEVVPELAEVMIREAIEKIKGKA